MNTKHSSRDWHIALQWAFFSTYGVMLGVPIGFALLVVWSFLRGNILHLAISPSVVDLIDTIIFASTTGAFLGVLQSRTLRFQNMGTRGWIAASILGLSIGAACIVALQNQGNLLKTTDNYLSIGAILGFVLGVAQWFILRFQIAKSSWWIVGNLVGGILSSAIIRSLVVLSDTIESPWTFLFFLFFFGFAVGIIYTTITGINMSWLLKSRIRASQEAG